MYVCERVWEYEIRYRATGAFSTRLSNGSWGVCGANRNGRCLGGTEARDIGELAKLEMFTGSLTFGNIL